MLQNVKRIVVWGVAALIVLTLARSIRYSLASDEQQVRWLFEDAVEGFNDGSVGPVLSALARDFNDETRGYRRDEIRRALVSLYFSERHPETKAFALRASLPEDEMEIAIHDGDPKSAEARLHVPITDLRRTEPTERLWWDARFECRLEERRDGWRIVRLTSANHRGRR